MVVVVETYSTQHKGVHNVKKSKVESSEKRTETRKERINLVVTETEKSMIYQKASEKHMSATEFIVRACEAVR